MEMKKTSAFDPPEFQERLRRVRARMAEKDLAALLLTTPENICYVSGYQTPGYYYLQALIVSVDRDPVIVTRLFEQRNVDAFSWLTRDQSIAYKDTEDPSEVIARTISELGLRKRTIGKVELISASRCEAVLGKGTRRADRRAGLSDPPLLSHW